MASLTAIFNAREVQRTLSFWPELNIFALSVQEVNTVTSNLIILVILHVPHPSQCKCLIHLVRTGSAPEALSFRPPSTLLKWEWNEVLHYVIYLSFFITCVSYQTFSRCSFVFVRFFFVCSEHLCDKAFVTFCPAS